MRKISLGSSRIGRRVTLPPPPLTAASGEERCVTTLIETTGSLGGYVIRLGPDGLGGIKPSPRGA